MVSNQIILGHQMLVPFR